NLDAEGRQGIVDRVNDGGWRSDRATLTKSFGFRDGVRARSLDMVKLDRRNFVGGRRQVLSERGCEDSHGVVVDDFLKQCVTDTLRNATVHLPVGDHRVDDASRILSDEEFFDLYMTGLDINIDDRNVTCVGKGSGRIVMPGFGEPGFYFALES